MRLLLLSGAIGVGKTTVANHLCKQHGFVALSSGDYLRKRAMELGRPQGRRDLQDLGDLLDEETNYSWIVDQVALPLFDSNPNQCNWLLDAVRKPSQIEHFRRHLGGQVRHVHLTADSESLRSRYAARERPGDHSYSSSVDHPNEIASRSLENHANLVVDTTSWNLEDITERILLLWKGTTCTSGKS